MRQHGIECSGSSKVRPAPLLNIRHINGTIDNKRYASSTLAVINENRNPNTAMMSSGLIGVTTKNGVVFVTETSTNGVTPRADVPGKKDINGFHYIYQPRKDSRKKLIRLIQSDRLNV
jgi:hypothetical protein